MPNEQRPLKVFLCHAHSDKTVVRNLYQRLIKDGLDAWLDKEKLLPGQDWEYEIRKAVREADVVVVCLSKQFNQAGFRQKEVRLALDTAMEKPEGDIFIIPARLEECENLENLRRWHEVDLFDEDGYEMLTRALRMRAGRIGVTLQQIKGRPRKFKSPRTNIGRPIVTSSSNFSFADLWNGLFWLGLIFLWGLALWLVIALGYALGEWLEIESEFPLGVAAYMTLGGIAIAFVLYRERILNMPRSVLLIILDWHIGGIIGGTVGYLAMDALNGFGPAAYVLANPWLIAGLFGAISMGMDLRKANVLISWRSVAAIIVVLWLGFPISIMILRLLDSWGLAWGIGGAISGFVIGATLLRENLLSSRGSFVVLMIGWTAGGFVGGMVYDFAYSDLLSWAVITFVVACITAWWLKLYEPNLELGSRE